MKDAKFEFVGICNVLCRSCVKTIFSTSVFEEAIFSTSVFEEAMFLHRKIMIVNVTQIVFLLC